MCGLLCVLLLTRAGARASNDLLSIAGNYVEDAPIGVTCVDSIRFVVYEPKPDSFRYFVVSDDFVKLKGYKGYTNLGVLLDEEAEILDVWIVSSGDTRRIVNKIKHSGMLEQFCSASKGKQIKHVTGATVTCQVICRTIEQMLLILESKAEAVREAGIGIRDIQK
jgi:hypothetical protein